MASQNINPSGNESLLEDLCPSLQNNHFRNSCFTSPGTYSCAVDCFLEINYRLFLDHLFPIRRSEFFNLLLIVGSTELDENFLGSDNSILTLETVREPIWAKIIEYCPSFRNRDLNAEFSEIFSSRFFNTLTPEEKDVFEFSYCMTGRCLSCLFFFKTPAQQAQQAEQGNR